MLAAALHRPSGPAYVADDELDFEPGLAEVKPIAFYLPQFHPIAENDAWWGRGFTEWTSVAKAVPQFVGHYQPHLPGELGFYDLRVRETPARQIALARKYGIHGFCFHHYWFAGRRLLEGPFNRFLNDPGLDFPFCLCWANENWTRRWDGLDAEVLIGQSHSPEDDLAFIRDIEPALRDRRYIRVGGRPLLLVYRAPLLPDPAATAGRWRRHCREAGLGELYLVAAQTFGFTDPRPCGFDAAVEFPPHNLPLRKVNHRYRILNPDHAGKIYEYRQLVEMALERGGSGDWPTFRAVCPSWDNEARRPGAGHVMADASPGLYARWLRAACDWTERHHPPERRFVFINAWNEWAEGAHLEPDRRHGHAYLRATAEALRPWCPAGPDAGVAAPEGGAVARCAVIAHVFHAELWPELAGHIRRIPVACDLYVTLPHDAAGPLGDAVRADFPAARIIACDNRGRDMAPFLAALRRVAAGGYAAVCKIHTKRTPHRPDGLDWRADLLG